MNEDALTSAPGASRPAARSRLGWLLDEFAVSVNRAAVAATTMGAAPQPDTVINPTVWFTTMLPWGLLGTGLMTYLWFRHRGTDERGT